MATEKATAKKATAKKATTKKATTEAKKYTWAITLTCLLYYKLTI